MENKKRLILALALLLIFLSVVNFYTAFTITGKATAVTTGKASICIVKAPDITSIAAQSATVGTAYTLQVDAVFYGTNTSITYSDNTDLFDINQSGYISFTPTSGNVGTHTITITITDASDCLTVDSTATFLLTVSEVVVPPPETPGGGGGGGGGGGAPAKKQPWISFKLSDELLKVNLKESQMLEKTIIVTNNGDANLIIEIKNLLPAAISLFPVKFNLLKEQEQEITAVFNPYLDTKPDVYSGLITFIGSNDSQTVTKTATVILEIESEEVLFDASLDLPQKTFSPGDELQAAITIYNLQNVFSAEVTLIHSILDMNNKVVYQEEEMTTLKDKASFAKTIPLAEDLPPGQYLYSLKVLYKESFATASDLFTVEEPVGLLPLVGLAAPITKKSVYFLGIPLLFVLIGSIVLALYFTHRKIKKSKTILKPIIQRKTIIKPRTIIRQDNSNLRSKLLLLKEGYSKGFIKESTYRQAKEKIENLIRVRG
ncbi:MAG: hypothetical protein AABW48_00005 [Nanoarchaeota archaeon]